MASYNFDDRNIRWNKGLYALTPEILEIFQIQQFRCMSVA